MENSTTLTSLSSLAHAPTSRLKRYIAGLFDTVLLFFIHYALYSLVLLSPIANTMNSHMQEMIVIRDGYKLSTGYGEKHNLTLEEYNKNYSAYHLYSEGDPIQYYVVTNVQFESEELRAATYKEYEKATLADDAFQGEMTAYHIHNYLITAALCGGVLEAVWLLIIPLIRGCGQTPGMFITGIRMISTKHYGKPKWYQYLGRFGFIFVVESLLPYFFLSQWTLIVVPIIEIIFIAVTERHRALHDLVSATMVVEKAAFENVQAARQAAVNSLD